MSMCMCMCNMQCADWTLIIPISSDPYRHGNNNKKMLIVTTLSKHMIMIDIKDGGRGGCSAQVAFRHCVVYCITG